MKANFFGRAAAIPKASIWSDQGSAPACEEKCADQRRTPAMIFAIIVSARVMGDGNDPWAWPICHRTRFPGSRDESLSNKGAADRLFGVVGPRLAHGTLLGAR
jgi:hypothetical protein